MLKLLFGFIVCYLTANNAYSQMVAKDKADHFNISILLGTASNQLLPNTFSSNERIIVGTLLGTLPGFLKELADMHNNKVSDREGFSRNDLVADFLGSLVGNLYSEKIRIYTKKDPNYTIYVSYFTRF